MFDDPIAMLYALLRASNGLMAKLAVQGVIEYLIDPEVKTMDSDTLLEIIAQCLSNGYAQVDKNAMSREDMIAEFRKQLEGEDDDD